MLVMGNTKNRVSPFKLCGILLVLGMVASCITCVALMHTFHVLFCACNSTVVALGTLKGPLEMARVSVMRRVNVADRPLTGKDIMHGNNMDIQQQMQFLCDPTIPDARKFPLHDSAFDAITSYFRDTSLVDEQNLKKMFRKMSQKVRPDKNQLEKALAEQAFICLQASYNTYTQLCALSWKERADRLLCDWQKPALLVLGPCLSFEEIFGVAFICISFIFVLALKAKKWVLQALKGN